MINLKDVTEILAHTDHTCLKPDATKADIEKLIKEAETYNVASVCIPPSFARYAKSIGCKVPICVVIGFPLGYSEKAIKIAEAKRAIEDGACEIDMVINIGNLKDKEYTKIKDEIVSIKKIVGDKVLKVIVETCLLNSEEIAKITQIVSLSGADYIKTSTGFSKEGAKKSDIEIFKKNMPVKIKIKAAGGIRTLETAKEFLQLGCDRIGASSLVKEAEKFFQ